MILRFDDGNKCCCDKKFPLCQQCEKKRRKRYRGDRDDAKVIKAESERIAKLEREDERRKEVRSAWLREHGYEIRA